MMASYPVVWLQMLRIITITFIDLQKKKKRVIEKEKYESVNRILFNPLIR